MEKICKKCIGVDCLAINNDDYGWISGALVSEYVDLNIPNRLLPLVLIDWYRI